MARELSIDMAIQPFLDERAVTKTLLRLKSKLESGVGQKSAERLATRLISHFVQTGRAVTETQGRIIVSQLMGGRFAPEQAAILRKGQNLAQTYRQQQTAAQRVASQKARNEAKLQAVATRAEQREAARKAQEEEKSKRLAEREAEKKERAERRSEELSRKEIESFMTPRDRIRLLSQQAPYDEKNADKKPETGKIYRQADVLQKQLSRFADSPNKINSLAITQSIKSLQDSIGKHYIEQRQRGRKIEKSILNIERYANQAKKHVSDFDSEQQAASGGGFFGKIAAFISNPAALVAGAVASGAIMIAKKVTPMVAKAFDRGLATLRTEAAYGRAVNMSDIRTRAELFNMPIESAMAPNRYAADFQQRMMWGEVSEREIIGLARAGKWGRMVMTGEAARNPEKANAVFEQMVASTNPAQMRHIMSQLGLPVEDLMSYRMQPYSPEQRAEYAKLIGELVETEKGVTAGLYDLGNQISVLGEQLSALAGKEVADVATSLSPQAQDVANRLGYQESTTLERRAGGMVERALGLDEVVRDLNKIPGLKAASETLTAGIATGQYPRIINTDANPWGGALTKGFLSGQYPRQVNVDVGGVTINGNVDENNVDNLVDQITDRVEEKINSRESVAQYYKDAERAGALTGF